MDSSENLSLSIHGNFCIAEFPGIDNVCIRAHMVSQGEWKMTSGNAALTSSFSFRGVNNSIYIDLPFQFSLRGASPFLWPRLVLNCFSKNNFGDEVIVGYGFVSIPSEPGKHSMRIYCFLPVTSSTVQWLIGKIRGSNEEFLDPLFPAFSSGRDACQTSSVGYVDVELNVSVRSIENGFHFSSNIVEQNSSFDTSPPQIPELENVRKQ